MGPMKRVVTLIVPDPNAEKVFCGTTTGDVLEVDVANRVFKSAGPCSKDDVPIPQKGVESLRFLSDGSLVIGSGAGNLLKVDPATWEVKKSVNLDGPVNSISPSVKEDVLFCGTATS